MCETMTFGDELTLCIDERCRPCSRTEDNFIGVECCTRGGFYAGDVGAGAVVQEGGDVTCWSRVERCS